MYDNLPKWKSGDDITANDLNALARAGETALALSVDPATGLSLMNLPHGRILRGRRKLECWIKITSGGTSGIYAGTQQLETSTGTWANGPNAWTVAQGTLREANLATTVAANTIVRAWHDSFFWRFQAS